MLCLSLNEDGLLTSPRAVDSFKGFQQMSVFSDALKKANGKNKIANAQICPFWCVKLNVAPKKCVNCNFSEICFQTLECS